MALIKHLKLDDNAASTTVVATVGTNGTLEGGDNTSAKSVAGPGGIITLGFDLNGVDDAIIISGVTFINGDAFSVSFWAEWDLAIGRPLGETGGLINRILKVDDTTIRVTNGAGVSSDFTVASMGTSNWCHILITRTSGNSMRVFLNGVESSTGALTRDGAFVPTRIGRQTANYHDGKLAQFKIFDTDESANVAALYAEGITVAGGGRIVNSGVSGSPILSA